MFGSVNINRVYLSLKHDELDYNRGLNIWWETQENVMSNVETIDGHWLPHPEEKIFLDQLYLFMERRGSPICKVPNLGFKKSEY